MLEPANTSKIEVSRDDVEQFMSRFTVLVLEDDSTSHHVVTLSGADWERLGKGYGSPEAFVEACFGFLLAREPKEQILASFDISQIGRYYPDFERAVADTSQA